MPFTKTQIANLALRHLGHTKPIIDFDTEQSEAARTMRDFYDVALEQTLRDGLWPFARRFVTLALVANNPTTEWLYSYRYPSDCVYARRILSGIRNDTRQSIVPFVITSDSTGKLIYTDQQTAVLEFTAFLTVTALFPADFVQALALRLATYAAPYITAGDPFRMGQRAMELYVREVSMANTNAAQEGQDEEMPRSEFERFRD